MPKQVTVEHAKDRLISLSDNLYFKIKTSSKIMIDAIKRYKTLICSHNKCTLSDANEIGTIVIILSSDSEAVNIDTNYNYELVISNKTRSVTITASSPFGAMYVICVKIVYLQIQCHCIFSYIAM